jgi:hypothetical protein
MKASLSASPTQSAGHLGFIVLDRRHQCSQQGPCRNSDIDFTCSASLLFHRQVGDASDDIQFDDALRWFMKNGVIGIDGAEGNSLDGHGFRAYASLPARHGVEVTEPPVHCRRHVRVVPLERTVHDRPRQRADPPVSVSTV